MEMSLEFISGEEAMSFLKDCHPRLHDFLTAQDYPEP
jgi:hypothetical protein